MPIVRLCSSPNCNEFAVIHSVYCSKHKQESDKKRVAFQNARRYNSKLYKTQKWQRLRKKHLKDNNYCVFCGSRHNLTVDHIVPPKGKEDLFFNEDNLQTLCHSCHVIKTLKEIKIIK